MKKFFVNVMLLLFFSPVFAQEAETQIKVVPIPAGFTKQLDVVYKEVNEWKGRMDIYLPPKNEKRTPVLINMHGGAWRHGTKEAQGGFNTYFKLGFAVANVEYRLSQQASAPGGIEDVRCAMMYLINHADSLNIDVNKIVFCGSSAGAHLALLAGLMDNKNDQFDKGCDNAKVKFKVAAIIAQSTPSTLVETGADGQTRILKDGAIAEWMGSRKNDVKFAEQLSPITYVSKDNPPVFISHGDADPRVPYQQSVALDAKMTKVGAVHVFITIPGGGHGGYQKEKQDEIKAAITVFLKEHVLN